MIHLQGRIRDYASATDTASVELDGQGVIDAWLDGVQIDPAVNRAFLYHGGRCTLAVDDPHRLDEAVITAIADSPTTPVSYAGAAKQTTQSGRGAISVGGAGSGSVAVSYSPGYSSAPSIQVVADNRAPLTLSALSASGFTVAVSGQTPNTYLYFSWQAVGN